jgi:hypothetical protein
VERTFTSFTKLNEGWNAEPGAPLPEMRLEGHRLILSFYLNPWLFPEYKLLLYAAGDAASSCALAGGPLVSPAKATYCHNRHEQEQ